MEYMKYIIMGGLAANIAIDVSWWVGGFTLAFLYLICLEIDAIRKALK
jgi:hypothetical protein